ncbi:MAG: magnesium transporter CorA family protein [Burkholderiales bacterium]
MQRLAISTGSECVTLERGASLPDQGFLWIDGTYDQVDALIAEIEALTGHRLFENHALDARNLGHPSFFDNTESYEMIVFRGLIPSSDQMRIETRPLFFFRFDRLLATLHPTESPITTQMRVRLLAPGTRYPRNPDELAHRILSATIDQYLELRTGMTRRLERWQRELLDPRRPFSNWYGLLEQRNEVRQLEHLSEGQLDAVQEWRDARFDQMSDELQVRFADLVEHIERVRGHARRIDAQIESAVQLHFSAVSHRTSEIIRTLTLITAIFMPLTLITGIFGMNFEVIPGLHSAYGFWLILAGMAIVVVAMWIYFRVRRWV